MLSNKANKVNKKNEENIQEGVKNLSVSPKKKTSQEDDDDEEEDDENEEGEDIEIPIHVQRRVDALRKLHAVVESIDEEYKIERIQLEAKYRDKKSIVYEDRKKVITGITPIEITETDVSSESVEADVGIPNFWLQALGNHPAIADIICDQDIEALSYLEDIQCNYSEDYKTFTLLFEFKENPFFTNKILTKRYTLVPYLLDEKSPSLTDSEGTVIEWRPGKNLCVLEVKKKQKAKSGKNKGQTRTIVKEIPRPSFFHYFGEPKEDEEEEEEKEEEEEEKERIQLTEEEDFEVAHIIRTAILPDAVLWFTGEAHADGYDDDEDEEDEEDDENEENDDEGDDDDDDDEDDSPKGKSKPRITKTSTGGFASAPSSGAGKGPSEQPECKQN